MFINLLIASVVVAGVLSFSIVSCFRRPLRGILERIVGENVCEHWFRFAVFVLYIVGVACGVQTYRLERYIQKRNKDEVIPVLDTEAWVFELYQVIEGTLSGLARAMVTLLVLGLIAVVVLRVWGERRDNIKSETKSNVSE